jgi:hypothetical protein
MEHTRAHRTESDTIGGSARIQNFDSHRVLLVQNTPVDLHGIIHVLRLLLLTIALHANLVSSAHLAKMAMPQHPPRAVCLQGVICGSCNAGSVLRQGVTHQEDKQER